MLLGALGGIHHAPQVADGRSHRYLHESVRSVLHAVDAHLRVHLPRGINNNGIGLQLLEHLDVGRLAAVVLRRALAGLLLHHVGGLFGEVTVQVTHTYHLAVRHMGKLPSLGVAALAQADDGHAHGLDGRGAEATHVDGALRTRSYGIRLCSRRVLRVHGLCRHGGLGFLRHRRNGSAQQ